MSARRSPLAILKELRLAEKIGQLNMLHGATLQYAAAIRRGQVGSFLVGTRPEGEPWSALLNKVQRIAVRESRTGIPLIFARDVIHGFRTIFPIPLGIAATFHAAHGQKMAEVSARECLTDGIRWTFAPMLDIARDARWGRIAESCGEDPFLAQLFARSIVRGFQGTGNRLRVAACAKHFIGYGAAEGGRDYNTTAISSSELWNSYLPPFQAAIAARVSTVMASFNDLNGVPMHQNVELLQLLLREKLGFQGVIVSDWNAIRELINHRTVSSTAEATQRAMEASVDIDMFSESFVETLATLVRSKKVALQRLDDAVLRILSLKERLGLFEQPYTKAKTTWRALPARHRVLARRQARESIVLLKNDGDLLPLGKKHKKIVVVGPLASEREAHLGTWSLDGRASDVVSVAEAVHRAAPKGVDVSTVATLPDHAITEGMLADAVICVVGEHPSRSGETGSVTAVELPPGQRDFVRKLAQTGTPLILVVCAGRPLALEEEAPLAQSILFCFHLGTEAGSAVADLLFGKHAPSGRLPTSLPRSTGQLPLYYNAKSSGRPADKRNRFTSRYCDSAIGPLFPFGYGLTYGKLEISASVTGETLPVALEVTVHNRGDFSVLCPVLLFVSDLVRSVTPPVRELRACRRISLPPQGKVKVRLKLDLKELSFTKDESTVCEEGDFLLSLSVGHAQEWGCMMRLTNQGTGWRLITSPKPHRNS